MTERNQPLLSVMMITFNQKDLITQALDSALAQQTNFPFEIVIGDDASMDGTRKIVAQAQEETPGLVRALLHDENLGNSGAGNLFSTFDHCRGQFIAWLEGDDYWTSPHKLQAQVDLLLGRPELSLSFCDAQIVNQAGTMIEPSRVPKEFRRDLSQEEILTRFGPPSQTVVFRRAALPEHLPRSWLALINLDTVLMAYAAARGPAGYLDMTAAAYRQSTTGVWSTRTRSAKRMTSVRTYRAALREGWVREPLSLKTFLCHRYEGILRDLVRSRRLPKFLRFALEYLVFDPVGALRFLFASALRLGFGSR